MRALALLFLASCLQIGTSDSGDAGTNDKPEITDAAPVEAAQLTSGSECAVDPVSMVTLCLRLDRCPGVRVDPDLYPDCGFRVPGPTIDLECICGDFLCPVGSALGCDQARELIAEQSAAAACVQVNEARCAPRGNATATKTSSCDRGCAAECAGAPGCLTLCGC